MNSNVQATIIKKEGMEDTIMMDAPINQESVVVESTKTEEMARKDKTGKKDETVKKEADSEDVKKRVREEVNWAKLRSVIHRYHAFGQFYRLYQTVSSFQILSCADTDCAPDLGVRWAYPMEYPDGRMSYLALTDIPCGTEVYRGAPIIKVKESSNPELAQLAIEAQYATLPPITRQFIMNENLKGRCNCGKSPCTESEVVRLFNENRFVIPANMTPERTNQLGFYMVACHLDHSCNPLVGVGYTHTGEISLRAMTDIAIGEVLTIPYIDLTVSIPERQALLKDIFGKKCACTCCKANVMLKHDDYHSIRGLGLVQQFLVVENRSKTQAIGRKTAKELKEFMGVDQFLEKVNENKELMDMVHCDDAKGFKARVRVLYLRGAGRALPECKWVEDMA